jgi:hypothetical protein
MSRTGKTAESSGAVMLKVGRLVRFLIFLCTAGWAFPHVCTEGMDLTRIQNGHMARKP